MSVLKHRINEDMKAALRARESPRLGAIRLLMAAVKQREVDERKELSDDEVVSVIDKMLKQRRDSIFQYQAAGRQDLVEAEQFEISVLQAYMPESLSGDEVRETVVAAVREC
ncbi:MAG: GatB/YqeY domain-containing protein, partial [Rhodocyclaceae bacterium]|nr:GatB/YqeY domain-containing protein [Rhodocyclaceae bacterium]